MIKIPEEDQQGALESYGYAVSGEDVFLDLHDVACVINTEGSRGGKIIFKNGTELSVTSGTSRGLVRAMRRWKIAELELKKWLGGQDENLR